MSRLRGSVAFKKPREEWILHPLHKKISMTSRTYRNCEKILRTLIEQYGPFSKVGAPLVEKAVIVNVGGDPRTVTRYINQMVLLEFIKERGVLYSLNWKKSDYAQTSLQESLPVLEEPP